MSLNDILFSEEFMFEGESLTESRELERLRNKYNKSTDKVSASFKAAGYNINVPKINAANKPRYTPEEQAMRLGLNSSKEEVEARNKAAGLQSNNTSSGRKLMKRTPKSESVFNVDLV